MDVCALALKLEEYIPSFNLTVGDYDIVDWLGKGGFGCVVKARNRKTGKAVAIKIYAGSMDDEAKVNLFKREYFLLKKLQDGACERPLESCRSMLPEVYGDGHFEIPGTRRPCFAMELLESYDEYLKAVEDEHVDARAEDFMLKLCKVVEGLHANQVYHRDIKFANIMKRTGSPDPVLVDFGIAVTPSLEDMYKSLLWHSGTPGEADRTQFEQDLSSMTKSEMAQAIDIFSLGNLIGDYFSTRSEARGMERSAEKGYMLQPVVREQWLRIESVCRARKWWDRYKSVSDLREAITNRWKLYREWQRKAAGVVKVIEDQRSANRMYRVDDDWTEYDDLPVQQQDGVYNLKLEGRSIRIHKPIWLGRDETLWLLGPGVLAADVGGDPGSLVVVGGEVMFRNLVPSVATDGETYFLRAMVRGPGVQVGEASRVSSSVRFGPELASSK